MRRIASGIIVSVVVCDEMMACMGKTNDPHAINKQPRVCPCD